MTNANCANNEYCATTVKSAGGEYENDCSVVLGKCKSIGTVKTAGKFIYSGKQMSWDAAQNWCAKQNLPLIDFDKMFMVRRSLDQTWYHILGETYDLWVDDKSRDDSCYQSSLYTGESNDDFGGIARDYSARALCGTPVLCMTNADCASGEYCRVFTRDENGDEICAIQGGTCELIGTVERAGIYVYSKGQTMNWDSAENWCAAQGLPMVRTENIMNMLNATGVAPNYRIENNNSQQSIHQQLGIDVQNGGLWLDSRDGSCNPLLLPDVDAGTYGYTESARRGDSLPSVGSNRGAYALCGTCGDHAIYNANIEKCQCDTANGYYGSDFNVGETNTCAPLLSQ